MISLAASSFRQDPNQTNSSQDQSPAHDIRSPALEMLLGLNNSAADSHRPKVESYVAIRQMMRTFNRFPALRQQILAPQNAEEIDLSKAFEATAVKILGRYIFDNYCRELIRFGHLSVDRLKKLHNIDCFSNPGADYNQFIQDLIYISDTEKKLLLRDREHFQKVLGFLDQSNKQLVLDALCGRRTRTVEHVMASSLPVSF